jgi:biopolymer transport protein TolR
VAFGRLERQAGDQPMSDINMTPLIDVMLVLVVILIITAPLLASSIKLHLPKTEAARSGQAAAAVTVAIDAGGQVFLQDRLVSLSVLATELAAAQRANPDTELRLRADQSVPYGRVVEVMGVAQKVGLFRIGFVAEGAPGAAAAGVAAQP